MDFCGSVQSKSPAARQAIIFANASDKILGTSGVSRLITPRNGDCFQRVLTTETIMRFPSSRKAIRCWGQQVRAYDRRRSTGATPLPHRPLAPGRDGGEDHWAAHVAMASGRR